MNEENFSMPDYRTANRIAAWLVGMLVVFLGVSAALYSVLQPTPEMAKEGESVQAFAKQRTVFEKEAKDVVAVLEDYRARHNAYPSETDFQRLIESGSLRQSSIGRKQWFYARNGPGFYRLEAPMNEVRYPTFFYDSKLQYFGGDF